ncbi:MAG: hypothetical protein ACE5Z5_07215 [Candidatus Bathyarchaeia archaeon]
MEVSETIFKEGGEIVEWVKGRGVNLVSVILFGSAARRWRRPGDMDVLIVVDEPDLEIDKLYRDFHKIDLALSKKYGLFPELTILKRDSIGRGSPLFYYSIVRDGVVLSGSKDLFIDALVRLEGREGLERACGLERAYSFLRHAERDIKDAKELTDLQLAAEGAYRACVEAIYALLRRHGMPIPRNHEEEREKLRIIDEIYPDVAISGRYSTLFEHLHAECFYHGECEHVRVWIISAREFVDDLARLL